ncbi:MAG: DUF6573 family protein [bacterium]
MENPFSDMSVISTYSRAQAIEDGVLIDVTEEAKQAGFTIPVAVTQRLHAEYLVPDERADGQSYAGRLWDVLYLLRMAIRSNKEASLITFQVGFIMKAKQKRTIGLKSQIHGGDAGEPVITISLPTED